MISLMTDRQDASLSLSFGVPERARNTSVCTFFYWRYSSLGDLPNKSEKKV